MPFHQPSPTLTRQAKPQSPSPEQYTLSAASKMPLASRRNWDGAMFKSHLEALNMLNNRRSASGQICTAA
jgi:hypothetical protein